MKQRLQKFLAHCGVASRRKCEELILSGKVTVNGRAITQLGTVIEPDTDSIVCAGKLVRALSFLYWALNKPPGVICSCRKSEKRQRVIDFFPAELGRLYPVGRLDVESEGLIFLTNDGSFCNIITHPSFNISKTYTVWLHEVLSQNDIQSLRSGILVDSSYVARPKILKVFPLSTGCKISLSLNEGRNREIRKMFAELNKKVVRLCRTSIGSVTLGGLPSGQFRKLASEEVEGLFQMASKHSEKSKP